MTLKWIKFHFFCLKKKNIFNKLWENTAIFDQNTKKQRECDISPAFAHFQNLTGGCRGTDWKCVLTAGSHLFPPASFPQIFGEAETHFGIISSFFLCVCVCELPPSKKFDSGERIKEGAGVRLIRVPPFVSATFWMATIIKEATNVFAE